MCFLRAIRYNMAQLGRFYAPPQNVIFWKDEGDAVLTFKKNGKWYLHGVGGRPFFERSGLTWQLIADQINMRYLPPGYILDSGAPCAFLREGIDPDELWFILGWTNSATATRLLKTVLNHTRNIQGKDIERLPYPSWVSPEEKARVVREVRSLVHRASSIPSPAAGRLTSQTEALLTRLDYVFALPEAGRFQYSACSGSHRATYLPESSRGRLAIQPSSAASSKRSASRRSRSAASRRSRPLEIPTGRPVRSRPCRSWSWAESHD